MRRCDGDRASGVPYAVHLHLEGVRSKGTTMLTCSGSQASGKANQEQKNKPTRYQTSKHLCRFTSGSRFYILIPRANKPNGSAVGIGTAAMRVLNA